MKTFYVHTNMGYYGTDGVIEVEAENEAEAYGYALAQLVEDISITVCETEEEAEGYC